MSPESTPLESWDDSSGSFLHSLTRLNVEPTQLCGMPYIVRSDNRLVQLRRWKYPAMKGPRLGNFGQMNQKSDRATFDLMEPRIAKRRNAWDAWFPPDKSTTRLIASPHRPTLIASLGNGYCQYWLYWAVWAMTKLGGGTLPSRSQCSSRQF